MDLSMLSVAIMGAGPIGLYTAILLKKQYPFLDVRVFDKNADEYARPGVIAKMALETINSSFEKIGIPPLVINECGGKPTAIYIRDLQHALYAKAHESGVTIISENYVGLDRANKAPITQHPSGSQSKQSPCDLLIDCTGERRAVMSSFQQAKPIATNPVPNHFVAYIDVSAENDHKIQNSLAENAREQGISVAELQKKMLTSFTNLSQFRTETGWKEFEPPKIDIRRWDKPREHVDDCTAGYCLYFETPDFSGSEEEVDEEILKDRHRAYLTSLLRFYTGEDIDFYPCIEPGTFQPFSVQPKKLETLVDNTQGFPVIALGDSFMSAEYTQGTGVRNGVECANGLISSLEISTEIRINDALWHSNIDHVIARHTTEVSRDYAAREEALASTVHLRAYNRYKEYKLTATEPESEATINSIKDLVQALKNSGNKWTEIKIKDEVAKNRCVEFYCAALELLDAHPDMPDYGNQKTKILSNLGRLYFNIGKFDEAIDCLNQALLVAQTHNVISMLEPTKLPAYIEYARLGKELSILPNGQQERKKELLENLLRFSNYLNQENRDSYKFQLKKVNTELASIEKTQQIREEYLKKKTEIQPPGVSSTDTSQNTKK